MKIYHNPRCTKSREGLAIVQEAGADVEIVEYLKNPITAAELADVVNKLGIPAEKLIRKAEKDFKENFKGKSLSDKEWIDAMIQYPKLIQRPILVKGDKAVLGRPPEDFKQLL